MFFNVMGVRYVVLNSFKATNDLLERKGIITANRARLTMGGDLVGWNNATVFLQYGDTYRKHRKLFQQQLGTNNTVQKFYPVEEEEAKKFIRNLSKNPDDLIAHCRKYVDDHGLPCDHANVTFFGRAASSLILRISHGYRANEDGGAVVQMVDEAMKIFSTVMTPGRFLVDMLPFRTFHKPL